MMGNLVSPRAHSRPCRPMDEHDHLPPVLRLWVAHAALPWSAASVRRIFARALAETGCAQAALARLDRAEAATLARDAPLVWGAAHPAARRPSGLSQSAGRAA
jgi:hypothetical protein